MKNKIKHIIKSIFLLFKRKKIVPINIITDKEELLEGKVALIIGGDGGIGYAIAKKFISSNAKVIISGTNDIKLKKCAQELGKNANYIKLNLYNISEFKTFIDSAENLFGKLDILVNCSGRHINRKNLDFLSTTEEEYDNIMDLNLKGNYFLTQIFAKKLISKKVKGHILFISSQSALEPSWSPYRLSKKGIDGLIEGLAQQLVKYDIIVNGIGPGPTATYMQNYEFGDSIYTEGNPIKRYTMPEEIAEYSLLLCSDLGNTIIGQTIYMAGGRGIIEKR